jgi:hypothetical protein
VRVGNIDPALQSRERTRDGCRPSEKRNVDKSAARVQRDSRNIGPLRNAFNPEPAVTDNSARFLSRISTTLEFA